ncbi:hypothetical protein [Dechloromonas sp.]|uniref:hypothetical protein n=1 Tax=Dechloromonas sp. TaxID=1917218 RepID=UPI00286D97C1|nr:hypothetical protein [Dechloromonas sp.]
MLKSMKTLITVVIAIALAFALNPSAEKHRDKIKTAIAERSQVERVLGIGQLTSFVSQYHSLGVASYTTVNDKVTSIGVFGMVFVP